MKSITLTFIITMLVCFSGCTQTKPSNKTTPHVGGSCEGCEAINESPVPFDKLKWTDTLPDYFEKGPKMEISGVIFNANGTPAKDVVLYVYHTDQTGHYSRKGNETGWAKRHGYIRGWVKTNELGQYKFYTLKPASYPQSSIPAHIHPTIKEPRFNEYWIDEYVFNDDPFLTEEERIKHQQRGGNGIITLENKNGILVGKRDIFLGKNIPGYPKDVSRSSSQLSSGLAIGSNCPAFDPMHITGPDAGSKACPMCKYGYGQGIMVWWNDTNLKPFIALMKKLEAKIEQYGYSKLRVFSVFMNPQKWSSQKFKQALLNNNAMFSKVAVVIIPSPTDPTTAGAYHIKTSQKIKNTIFIYKKRKVAEKFVNYDAAANDFSQLFTKLL